MHYPRIKEVRIENDTTQQQVATMLKITQQQYQLYESGKRTIPTDVLQAFCRVFGVSADYILELPKNLLWPR